MKKPPSMGIKKWCGKTVERDRTYGQLGLRGSSRSSMWKVLWEKLKRENKRFVVRSSSVHVHQVPYDEDAYLQNFDQGLECNSPDILSRSFSVRYTDRPSVMV